MKKFLAKLCAMLLAIAIAIPGVTAFADETEGLSPELQTQLIKLMTTDYTGKTVILHTNDVHGEIEGYAYVKAAKTLLEGKGAEVILVDCGDYSQGSTYVSVNKGKNAVTMMNAAGYDIAILGNHEFDFGTSQLNKNLKKAKFRVLSANVCDSKGKNLFKQNTIWVTKAGFNIGFFGLETPEAQTKSNPATLGDVVISQGKDLYKDAQQQIDLLKESSDLIICLAHLGIDEETRPNNSLDVYSNTKGIDMILDGHSHTVMTAGPEGEPIQSTGTKFENVGVVVIDNESKKIESNMLIPVEAAKQYITPDVTVAKKSDKIIKKIQKAYGKVFATSETLLNGEKAPGNRTEETNLGDLVADAMLWEITKQDSGLLVDKDHVVAITNGGGIRATIQPGNVTMNDIKTVLPFGNTVTVVYITGAKLLEALEASTYCTPEAIGGFPQVAGIEYTINTKKAFKQGKQYPNSTYYAPKKIKRVTIKSINGQEFDKKALYAVVTNNFCASGGDTYYAFAAAKSQFDTGFPLDDVLVEYINEVLKDVISEETYGAPQGRITIK